MSSRPAVTPEPSTQSIAARNAAENITPTNVPAESTVKPDGIRDTIDSIVVAFILAFVFRAFIVEAFVIPTGSMAPSLYGMHGEHRCPKCGYSFVYGIREPMADPNNPNRIHPGTLYNDRGERQLFSVRCPNCTWDGEGNARMNTLADPVNPDSGDRILVLKWPYDFGGAFLGPQRWDVVVFKNPQDGEVNFIKRLLGLPGEVLQIINGDLYVAPAKSVPEDIVQTLSESPLPSEHGPRLSEEQFARLAKVLRIQRKTRVAQDNLWMLHFDQDFIPINRKTDAESRQFDPPYWEARDGDHSDTWDARTVAVHFKPGDTQQHWLDLKGRAIQDEYGYNNVNYSSMGMTPPRHVGDVLLDFVLFPGGGQGELCLVLQKGADQFRVRIASTGQVVLERFNESIRNGFWDELSKAETSPLVAGRPIEIQFENLDYRIALRMDDQEIVATDDTQYAPNLEKLLKQPYEDGRNNHANISIGAKLMPLDIRHLRVMRDVFYRSDSINDSLLFANHPGWGTALYPLLLRSSPQDFFCCGDNSPQSKDSRLWTEVCDMLRARKPPNDYQYGTVPGDQLIGRAFFVYWPSGLRFSRDTMGVIPNVGRMRLIR